MIEATEHVIIEAPTGMKVSDLAQMLMRLVTDITMGMQRRGYENSNIRFVGAPMIVHATAIPSPPPVPRLPPTVPRLQVVDAGASTDTNSSYVSGILGGFVSFFIFVAIFIRARRAYAKRSERQENQELQGRQAQYIPNILAGIESQKHLVTTNSAPASMLTSSIGSTAFVSTLQSIPSHAVLEQATLDMARPTGPPPPRGIILDSDAARLPPARGINLGSDASIVGGSTSNDGGDLMPTESQFARSIRALNVVSDRSSASVGCGRGSSIDGDILPPISEVAHAVQALKDLSAAGQTRLEDVLSDMVKPGKLPSAPGIRGGSSGASDGGGNIPVSDMVKSALPVYPDVSGSSGASPDGGGTSADPLTAHPLTSNDDLTLISQFVRSVQALKNLGAAGRASLERTLSSEVRIRHTPPSSETGSSSGGGIRRDGGESSTISQFRKSVAALKRLGVTGIRDEYIEANSSIQGATRQREVANIHTLIRSSSFFRRTDMNLNPRDDNMV
jgi:hypothetical protein